MKIVAKFEIRYSQFLDPQGKPVAPLPEFARDTGALPEFARDTAQLVDLYRWMVLMRAYDAKAIALQRTGQLGTFASLLGHEAVQAGAGSAMHRDDVFLGTYRATGL